MNVFVSKTKKEPNNRVRGVYQNDKQLPQKLPTISSELE